MLRDLWDNLKFWFFCGLLKKFIESNGCSDTDGLVLFETIIDILVDWRFIESDEAQFAFASTLHLVVSQHLRDVAKVVAPLMTDDELEARILATNDGHLL